MAPCGYLIDPIQKMRSDIVRIESSGMGCIMECDENVQNKEILITPGRTPWTKFAAPKICKLHILKISAVEVFIQQSHNDG